MDFLLLLLLMFKICFEQPVFEKTHPQPLSRGELGVLLNHTPLFYFFREIDINV
jgi:hypothetical protein